MYALRAFVFLAVLFDDFLCVSGRAPVIGSVDYVSGVKVAGDDSGAGGNAFGDGSGAVRRINGVSQKFWRCWSR